MQPSIVIELFTASNCNRCSEAKKRLRVLVEGVRVGDDRVVYRELNVLEMLDYAVSLGIIITPAIAINGKLIFTSLPSVKQFNDKIQQYLLM